MTGRSRWALAAGLALAGAGMAAAPPAHAQYAKATACDHAAGHPVDPDRVVPGTQRPDIDLEKAIATCKDVLATAPNHARTNYNLGRVLFYAGRGEEAVPYLERAAAAGYRQSIFVLGIIQFGAWADHCKALGNLRRAASLDHPFSSSTIVGDTLDGRFDACADKPQAAELRQMMALALDTITLAESRGRIEEINARLATYLEQQGVAR